MCKDIFDYQLKLFEKYNQENDENIFKIFETEAKRIFNWKNEYCKNCIKILCDICDINECDFCLPQLICFDQIICEYQYDVDYSKINNNDTQFLACNRIKMSADDLYKLNTNDNIVIILESPHVDEFKHIVGYKDGFKIGMPCMGRTGINLDKYFIEELDKCLKEVFNKDNNGDKLKNKMINDQDQKFNIIVMNAIQFQCSLGIKVGKEKNNLCEELLKKDAIKKIFIDRLIEYSPKYILNCSTKTIRGSIKREIKSKLAGLKGNRKKCGKSEAIVYIEGNHPSSWFNEKNRTFKKVSF
jgi:hypothetical protein